MEFACGLAVNIRRAPPGALADSPPVITEAVQVLGSLAVVGYVLADQADSVLPGCAAHDSPPFFASIFRM